MNSLHIVLGLSVLSLSLGCAVDAQTEQAVSQDDAVSTSVTPGTFVLRANVKPVGLVNDCEPFQQLEIATKPLRAIFQYATLPVCKESLNAPVTVYPLTASDGSGCGVRTYKGTAANGSSIEIQDERGLTCRRVRVADLIVTRVLPRRPTAIIEKSFGVGFDPASALSDDAIGERVKTLTNALSLTSEIDSAYSLLTANSRGAAISESELRTAFAASLRALFPDAADPLAAETQYAKLDVEAQIKAWRTNAADATTPPEYQVEYTRHADFVDFMRGTLEHVAAFRVASGEFGHGIYLYVGRSKSTGKLIAMAAEFVET